MRKYEIDFLKGEGHVAIVCEEKRRKEMGGVKMNWTEWVPVDMSPAYNSPATVRVWLKIKHPGISGSYTNEPGNLFKIKAKGE